MNTVEKIGVLALLLGLGLLVTPGDGSAQLQSCGLCDSSGSFATCNQSNSGQLYCTTVFLWTVCMGCELNMNDLPAQLTPDGSIAEPTEDRTADFEPYLQAFGEVVEGGSLVARKSCNGNITHRWYPDAVEERIRERTAVLTL
jgi:hypothetical protein